MPAPASTEPAVTDSPAVASTDRPAPPDVVGADRTPPPPSQGWAVVRLAVVAAAIVALAVAAGAGGLLIVIVAIIAMVMLHELGHLATAKWSKMLVTQYFVGFGPTLWSIRRGEIEYGVKAFPLGGFVKIPGMTNLEEVDPALEDRTYRQRPFGKRILVSSAGSIMHFLLAFLLLWVAYTAFGAPQSHGVAVGSFVPWQGHAQNAAQAGGLRPGDVIISAGGRAISTPTQLESQLNRSVGHRLPLVVGRGGATLHLSVVPQLARTSASGAAGEVIGPGKGARGVIGISEVTPRTSVSPVAAVGRAGAAVGRDTWYAIAGVGHIFSPSGLHNLYTDVTNSHAAAQASATGNRPQSLVGLTDTATQALSFGVYGLLVVLAFINIAFGIVNMLPMLPLDGGHVAIAIYEWVRSRGRRTYYVADAAKLLPVVYAFMTLLIVIVGAAFYLDIAHPISFR
ncbi:MAG TPA: site-2 protease family protein [Acidimicrobiales bacterium]|nr:site-2 protease family protein [Acidimicrobiales bacterium]